MLACLLVAGLSAASLPRRPVKGIVCRLAASGSRLHSYHPQLECIPEPTAMCLANCQCQAASEPQVSQPWPSPLPPSQAILGRGKKGSHRITTDLAVQGVPSRPIYTSSRSVSSMLEMSSATSTKRARASDTAPMLIACTEPQP